MKMISEKPIYQLLHAVSPAVCHQYIQAADLAGWKPTNIHTLSPLFSRTQAVIPIDCPALFLAILPGVPKRLDTLEIVSLIEQRTACMRYEEGEYFGMHTDTPFVSQDGARTGLSLVLYLNDNYTGGETMFSDLDLEVKPETGKVLLFPPTLLHLSKPVTRGSKYIIRSEVLYRPGFSQAE